MIHLQINHISDYRCMYLVKNRSRKIDIDATSIAYSALSQWNLICQVLISGKKKKMNRHLKFFNFLKFKGAPDKTIDLQA